MEGLQSSITMLEANNSFGSYDKPLMTALYAWNRRSIKVPVEIDLSRASSTLGKFATGAKFAGVLDLDFG